MSITKDYICGTSTTNVLDSGNLIYWVLADCQLDVISIAIRWHGYTDHTDESLQFRVFVNGTTVYDNTFTHTSDGTGNFTTEYQRISVNITLTAGDTLQFDFGCSYNVRIFGESGYSDGAQIGFSPLMVNGTGYHDGCLTGCGVSGSDILGGAGLRITFDDSYLWQIDGNNNGYPYSVDDYIYEVPFPHQQAGYAVDFWKIDSNNDGYPWTWGWTAPSGGGNWYIKTSNGIIPLTTYIKTNSGITPLLLSVKT